MKIGNKTLIVSVFICVCLMLTIGYAAFQTSLNITGTSSITSNWRVEITGVNTQDAVGSASNESEPVVSGTAVTFKTNLVSPGDSISYAVTVANNGTLSARLDKINTTDKNNPAITYSVTGISENDILAPKETKNVIVTVKYNEDVTTQPSVLTSSFTLSLDFVQN